MLFSKQIQPTSFFLFDKTADIEPLWGFYHFKLIDSFYLYNIYRINVNLSRVKHFDLSLSYATVKSETLLSVSRRSFLSFQSFRPELLLYLQLINN